jgi:hypothetical protein
MLDLAEILLGIYGFSPPNGEGPNPPIKFADEPIVRFVACLTH